MALHLCAAADSCSQTFDPIPFPKVRGFVQGPVIQVISVKKHHWLCLFFISKDCEDSKESKFDLKI